MLLEFAGPIRPPLQFTQRLHNSRCSPELECSHVVWTFRAAESRVSMHGAMLSGAKKRYRR
jgi:hypothetical protein